MPSTSNYSSARRFDKRSRNRNGDDPKLKQIGLLKNQDSNNSKKLLSICRESRYQKGSKRWINNKEENNDENEESIPSSSSTSSIRL